MTDMFAMQKNLPVLRRLRCNSTII